MSAAHPRAELAGPLTEADLDDALLRARADRARAEALHAATLHAALPRCCGGCNSNQGRRDCTCGAAALADDEDMWALERRSPWLLALYAAGLVAAIAASVLWPMGVAP